MYLDVLDKVQIKVAGEGKKLRTYLQKEYAMFEFDGSEVDEADVVVKLQEDVSSDEQSVHVRGPVAYDDNGVFLHHNLPGEDPQYNAFRIDFETLGRDQSQVSCDPDFNPHFFAIIIDYLIHFELLKHGATYCHSCAFRYNGKTIVCPAWRQVGKTNLLLSFLPEGAEYIADDWCVLNDDGTVETLPKRLNLLYYNFTQYPEVLEKTSDQFESLVTFIDQAKSGEVDLNQEAINTLTEQTRMRISPYDLFDNVVEGRSTEVDYIFFLQRPHNNTQPVELTQLTTEEFPHRKQSILEFEQSYFHTAYRVHKARTGEMSPHLEQSKQKTLEILEQFASQTPEMYELTAPSQESSSEMKMRIKNVVANN